RQELPGSLPSKRTVPAGTADKAAMQPSLSGLRDMPQLTWQDASAGSGQALPGYFPSRLSAPGSSQCESCDSGFSLAWDIASAGTNSSTEAGRRSFAQPHWWIPALVVLIANC